MARRRRTPFTRVTNGRITTWARTVDTITLSANDDYATLDLLGPFKTAGGVQQGATVVRTHLNLSVWSTVSGADALTWGLIRGQNTDEGINIAGAPDPRVDLYEDWMMWETRTADSNAHYWGPANNTTFDLKSKRKFSELQMSYNFVLTRILVTGDDDLVLTLSSSILLLLP